MQAQLVLKLGAVSDAELVEGLYRVVGSGRRLLAELLAHLCEVEGRRLHLDAGYPSLFAYCLARLGFTEDEAYRRISVARLARKAPIVLGWIAEGRLSLSVAALLQPYVLAPNLQQLIEAVAGKSVNDARAALVAFFPRPDVTSSIRMLPRTKVEAAPIVPAQASLLQASAQETRPPAPDPREAGALTTSVPALSASPSSLAPSFPVAAASPAPSTGRPSSLTQPLSPGRYRIQFTAEAALKDKFELARDLLRHAVPSGDLATIMDRALDLLVTDLRRRRFGAKCRNAAKPRASRCSAVNEPDSPAVLVKLEASNETAAHDDDSATDVRAERERQGPPPGDNPARCPSDDTSRIDRATRRAVAERDGLRCTWQGPDGVRCSSRAWLEHDHRIPRALGGTTSVQNLRLLCKAHNRRAAELVFGRRHIEKTVTVNQSRTPASREPPAR